MSVQLDELERNQTMDAFLDEGLDVHVIPQRIAVEKRPAHGLFKFLCRAPGIIFILAGIAVMKAVYPNPQWWLGSLLFIGAALPAILLWIAENNTRSYFEALQQEINQAAGQVDVFIAHRVTLMKSLARTVEKGLEQELHVMLGTAQERSSGDKDASRILINDTLNVFSARLEAYPNLVSNQYIVSLMDKDEKCMAEITAARGLYNDKVGMWNREIFEWAIKQIVAAECGYTTRIPFIASSSMKAENEASLF